MPPASAKAVPVPLSSQLTRIGYGIRGGTQLRYTWWDTASVAEDIDDEGPARRLGCVCVKIGPLFPWWPQPVMVMAFASHRRWLRLPPVLLVVQLYMYCSKLLQ